MEDIYKKIIEKLNSADTHLRWTQSASTVMLSKQGMDKFKKAWDLLYKIPIDLRLNITPLYIDALQEKTTLYIQQICIHSRLGHDLSLSQLTLLCKNNERGYSTFNIENKKDIICSLTNYMKNDSSLNNRLLALYLFNLIRPAMLKDSDAVEFMDRACRKTKMSVASTTTTMLHSKYINLLIKNYMPELYTMYTVYTELNEIEPCLLDLKNLTELLVLQKEEIKETKELPVLDFDEFTF